MRKVAIISSIAPAKPRSDKYPIGTSVARTSSGTTVINQGGGESVDIVKTGDSISFTDKNVLSSLRAAAEFISKKNDSSVEAVVDFLKGLKINSVPITRVIQKATKVDEFSDTDVMTALRVLAEIANNSEELKKIFLHKDKPDTAREIITFLKGLLIGEKGHGITLSASGVVTGILDELKNVFSLVSPDFVSGDLGAGFLLKYDPDTGRSYLEVDELLVRKIAYFVELVIKQLRHVGGEIILTPASMTCVRVEELEDVYRCYFQADDGTRSVMQEFVAGDQARCQTFNIKPGTSHNVTNKYYWRLVSAVGDDYIDLSKTDCDTGSGVPAAKDDIVQLGNRTDTSRQNAIILSTVGDDAPSIKQYAGINNYSMAGKAVTIFSPKGNRIIGDFVLTNGKSVLESLSASKQLALAISRGEMLFKDPVFKEGKNGLKRYNNGTGSSTVISRIVSADSPNESGYILSVTTEDANAQPGPGGVTWLLDGRANLALVMRIVAKIPAGYRIAYMAQALGEQTYEWLTPVDGTGEWQEYAVYVRYKNMPAASDGTAHVYKKCGYFYLFGLTPVTWYISYATIFDVNGVAPSYAVKSEVDSRFQVLNDRVTSEVRSEREFAMMLSKGKMLFKDPTFRNGTNGFYLFNNAQNTVSLSDMCIFNDMAPNDTRTCYEFTASGKTTDAKLGGFRFYNISTNKGRKFLLRMIAKIPTGYRIRMNALNAGTIGYERTFLNGDYGTGDFHEYLIRVTYGSDASSHTNSEFRIYLEGNTLPLTWQLAYATVFDLDGADPEYTSKTTFESSIKQLSDRITMEVHEQHELTSAVNGRMLHKNPTFKTIRHEASTNDLYKMDSTGTLSMERLLDNLHSIPNDSGYYLKIYAPEGSAPAGETRWVYWSFSSRANSSFSVRMLAKIPRGRKLLANTYNIGNGSQKWLTSNEGTGDWQEYIYLMRFGTDAENKNGNYVSLKLDVSTVPDFWYIAYGTVYDLNGSDPLYMESSYAESRFTQMSDRITSEVKRTVTTLTDYANAMQQGTMLHEDPTFMHGTNAIKQFSPKGEGTTISRIVVSDAPNDSKTVLNISTPAVSSTIVEPKVGGMRWEVYGKANMSVVIRIVAKIPSGAKLAPGISNASLTNHGWLTPNVGTGQWKEYIYKIQWSGTIPAGTNLSYGVFYIEGAKAPVTWQIAYAAIFDMNGQNPLMSVKSEFNSKITQLSDRITSEVKEVQTNTLALQRGSMLYEDATFKVPTYSNGKNGLRPYRKVSSADVLISRVAIANCPNDSGYGLEIISKGSGNTFNGITWYLAGKPNRYFVVRMIANIPRGYTLMFQSNSSGYLEYHGWLTENKGAGSGKWEEYVYHIKCGSLFSDTTAYFYLSGNTAVSVTWYISYATIYDMNGDSQLVWKNEYSSKIEQLSNEINMTVNAIGEKTSGSQIKLNPDKIKMAVFGDDGTGKANSLLSAINMDESGVKIKGDVVEVDANKFVARHVQTALSGPRIEMSGAKMDVYGRTALNIRFGVNDEGYAVLRYYDNNGNILYDLGPNGIFKLPSSAEVWKEIRLKKCGDSLVDALTSSHGYKNPYYANGKTYYTYTSKVVAGVVEDPENDGKIFLYNGSKSTPIPDGCYCHVPLSNSDPRTYWKETVTNQGMEIGSTGRRLTVRDFEELHSQNEPIYDMNPLYSISIFELSSGRLVDGCFAFWNGG